MSKRSTGQFERRKNDLYRTWDPRAVAALLPHLSPATRFYEPCAGEGDLIEQLVHAGHFCEGACDIDAKPDAMYKPFPTGVGSYWIAKADATKIQAAKHFARFDSYITNPPWTRELLHAIILNLYWQRPTWLLFDADWCHTLQSRPYMPLCRQIVPVGRLKWIEGSRDDGKDNVAWHLFAPAGHTEFSARAS